mmetsp:Transcript_14691/g.44862  ORF Transcript_14691/g.44862 Transcript_14691/m.44862 type:complete len:331 (+) Transcript_14691:104-1096(+)
MLLKQAPQHHLHCARLLDLAARRKLKLERPCRPRGLNKTLECLLWFSSLSASANSTRPHFPLTLVEGRLLTSADQPRPSPLSLRLCDNALSSHPQTCRPHSPPPTRLPRCLGMRPPPRTRHLPCCRLRHRHPSYSLPRLPSRSVAHWLYRPRLRHPHLHSPPHRRHRRTTRSRIPDRRRPPLTRSPKHPFRSLRSQNPPRLSSRPRRPQTAPPSLQRLAACRRPPAACHRSLVACHHWMAAFLQRTDACQPLLPLPAAWPGRLLRRSHLGRHQPPSRRRRLSPAPSPPRGHTAGRPDTRPQSPILLLPVRLPCPRPCHYQCPNRRRTALA